jgi:hypothetical protein
MERIGRNDPCPCGSGKKYKKCCSLKEKTRPGFTQDERASLLDKIDRFVGSRLGKEDDAAYESFYELWHDDLDDLDDHWTRMSEAVYDMWFFFDYNHGFAANEFVKEDPPLSPGERRCLELLRGSTLRLYEIEDLSPGKSLSLREVDSGTRVTVREVLGSRSLWRHALVAARVVGPGPSGQPEIESGLLQIPDLMRRQLLSQVSERHKRFRREFPQASEVAFYKELVPFLHDAWISGILEPLIPDLKNTDGEDLLYTRVRFRASEPEGVAAAFDGCTELSREVAGEHNWLWSGENREGKPVVFGRIVLKEQSLELECNSARRGETGRAMIERLAAGRVSHRSTDHENVARAVRDGIRSRNLANHPSHAPSREEIPREVQEALTLDVQARHYREWLDVPIPALDGHAPRDAAKVAALRSRLIDLIHGLEAIYELALKDGTPAYDPSWMWSELDLDDRSGPAHPPPMAHERLGTMTPGLLDACREAAERARRRPGFDDALTVLSAEDIRTDLEIQRFLRNQRLRPESGLAPRDTVEDHSARLLSHLELITNFEIHRRKTFWVDEALAFVLAQTDLDVPWSDLRVPFPSFALVFTDRLALSLAERMLSADPACPLGGYILRIVTAYVTEERRESGRSVRVHFAFDTLGADPPHLVLKEISLAENAMVDQYLKSLLPETLKNLHASDFHPLKSLLHLVLNAILYATSAGVAPIMKPSPMEERKRPPVPALEPFVFSSESVFFLPGKIDISSLRAYQALERLPSGRQILHRFMVRGHWRRAAANWKDQRLRWIEPYWKGPDLAAVIERAYKMKP